MHLTLHVKLDRKQESQWLQPQHSFSHKDTLTKKNQHRLTRTHTVAQRGIALTLAHTDPLAQP